MLKWTNPLGELRPNIPRSQINEHKLRRNPIRTYSQIQLVSGSRKVSQIFEVCKVNFRNFTLK
jgi:hypothetical protein